MSCGFHHFQWPGSSRGIGDEALVVMEERAVKEEEVMKVAGWIRNSDVTEFSYYGEGAEMNLGGATQFRNEYNQARDKEALNSTRVGGSGG
jgi:hypothetical protein